MNGNKAVRQSIYLKYTEISFSNFILLILKKIMKDRQFNKFNTCLVVQQQRKYDE